MGYDILVAVSFVVMTPVVLIGFVIFWTMNARDHDELARSWRSYAKRRGLTFVEPEGEWPNRTTPAIKWDEGQASFRLCAIGRESRVQTRLVVRPRSTLLGTLTLAIDGGGAGELTVREHPPGFAQRIASEHTRRLLLGLRQRDRVTVGYRRGRVTIAWPGGEHSEARLDDARRVASAIVSTIDAEFRAPASVRKPRLELCARLRPVPP